jgi:hypothetical protein
MPVRPRDRNERHISLYGDERGNWVLLESVTGIIPPPDLHAYAYEGHPAPPSLRVLHRFGNPRDLVTGMCEYMPGVVRDAGHGTPVQRTMARLLGVTQQSVSRYLNGSSEPDLPDEGWRQLTRLAAAWTERPGHPADFALVRTILTAELRPQDAA